MNLIISKKNKQHQCSHYKYIYHKYSEHKYSYQTGASSLLMVLIVMALGLLMLMGNKTQTTEYLKLLQQEVRFISETNRSYSALNWGMSLEWSIENSDELRNWECKSETSLQLQSCLKQSSLQDIYLLRAVSLPINNISQPIYSFVMLNEVGINRYYLNPLEGGWSDICPEKNERFCDD